MYLISTSHACYICASMLLRDLLGCLWPHTPASLAREPGSTRLEMDQTRQCMDNKEPSRVKFRRAEPDPRLLAVRLGSARLGYQFASVWRITDRTRAPTTEKSVHSVFTTAGQTLRTTRSAKDGVRVVCVSVGYAVSRALQLGRQEHWVVLFHAIASLTELPATTSLTYRVCSPEAELYFSRTILFGKVSSNEEPTADNLLGGGAEAVIVAVLAGVVGNFSKRKRY
ncbi:hypothetical protein J6590_066001 [Homalodisca vitripennis]|nr:hypothetical protein J6590_066001 [Homalodisca vitripennis]